MNNCELCNLSADLTAYDVEPQKANEKPAMLCDSCLEQIKGDIVDANYFRGLADTMWSENRSVQVLAYRLLNRLNDESWASDLLDIIYLDDDIKAWAESGEEKSDKNTLVHKDCNGVILNPGDTVTLIKDLNVKGVSFIAKRGTAVRRISLDPFNEEHIEGRVNGQKIVILTKFVKKSK